MKRRENRLTLTVEMKFQKRIGKSRLPMMGREVLKQEMQMRTRPPKVSHTAALPWVLQEAS